MTSDKSEEGRELGSELPSWTPELGSRLRTVVAKLGGGVPAGNIAGVSDEALSRYINGRSKPSFYALAALAKAADVSLDWIAGLDTGIKAAPQPPPITSKCETPAVAPAFDPDFLKQISKEVSEAYVKAGSRIVGSDLVSKSADIYAEIAKVSGDPTVREGILKFRLSQLEQELSKPALEQDRSKRRA